MPSLVSSHTDCHKKYNLRVPTVKQRDYFVPICSVTVGKYTVSTTYVDERNTNTDVRKKFSSED